MASLSELYQNVILEHNRSPRNYRTMPDANREAQGHNPLCGDQVTVRLRVEDGRIQDAAFQGMGCAIFVAAAAIACGSSVDRGFEGDPSGGDPSGSSGKVGEIGPAQTCVDGRICVGQDIYECGGDGKPTSKKLGDCANRLKSAT